VQKINYWYLQEFQSGAECQKIQKSDIIKCEKPKFAIKLRLFRLRSQNKKTTSFRNSFLGRDLFLCSNIRTLDNI